MARLYSLLRFVRLIEVLVRFRQTGISAVICRLQLHRLLKLFGSFFVLARAVFQQP